MIYFITLYPVLANPSIGIYHGKRSETATGGIMELTREQLGQRIRGARESCGLTQEQLAEPARLS
ncbi:MAG: helix-turn-helix domain-containing protein, partial [Steroidobacteraceae bacterium]